MAAAARIAWPPAQGLPQLTTGDEVHLIGIGGAGMSGLARALSAAGLVVSGCDQSDSPVMAHLAEEGIAVRIGHDPAHISASLRLIVHSPAIGSDNAELAAARAADIPITRRAVLLGSLMDDRIGVAVAGTHGKTTTSGLIATIVANAGLNPSFFVGGRVADLGTNAGLGSGDILIIEADEYDRSFLHGHPTIGVITSLEHDHPDMYGDLGEVVSAFRSFVRLVKPGGSLVFNAGSAGALEAVEGSSISMEAYQVEGDPEPPAWATPVWRATDLRADPSGQRFEVDAEGSSLGQWTLALPGRHNVGNALASIAVAERLGIDREVTRRVLADYRGADRRFEVIGTAGRVTVVDDYAHHPTEVAATIEAARQVFPLGKVIVVMQPHTYSRVAALAAEFARALEAADAAIVTPVYAARESVVDGVDARLIAKDVSGALEASDLIDAAHKAVDAAGPGDTLLFVGAGDITQASRAALALLQQRAARALVDAGSDRGLGGHVSTDSSLSKHTSLNVGGPADALVLVRSIDDLAGWWLLARSLGTDVRVIGRGTNLLVGDRGFRGLVLVNRCEHWELQTNGDGRHALLTAESGVTLAALGAALAPQGWGGLEAGIGIPGTVGAAVVTNAGAHGWSLADNLVSAEVLASDGTTKVWSRDDLAPRYRGSALKGDAGHVVLRVSLRLVREAAEVLAERIAGFSAHRRETQPTAASAGSIFKNPPHDHAGRLIDAAGLKGSTVGGALISPVHANFFLNHENASASDLHSLIGLARRTVLERFGVELELEIELLGEDGVQ